MDLTDLLGSPQIRRWHHAGKVKKLKDVDIPTLDVWNYGPCSHHDTPRAKCEYRACGGNPFKHQNKTAAFSYAAKKSIVGNNTGTGKTLSALLTLAIAHHYGETIRCLVVVPSTAVTQWAAETKRWTPGFTMKNIPPSTPKKDRLSVYASKWNILIMGYHSFTRDVAHIEKTGILQVVMDDIDPALNTSNLTYKALERICPNTNITIYQNATALSMNLLQLYAATSLIGGREVFGSLTNFNRNYVKKEPVYIYNKKKKKKQRVYKATGYHNVKDFKTKFHPMNIRFTYEDIADDVNIPDLVTERVYLDMSRRQRMKYSELQDGVRTILNNKDQTTSQKAINAMTAFTIGSQICAGVFALKTSDGGYEPDSPDASPKLDWIMDKLSGEWATEKVVVYSKFRGSIKTLQGRLKEAGIGYSTIWGMETDPQVRQTEMDKFWEDPKTRVMIISVSGERSLNLQNASILVMWDMVLNPARVQQLAGRVRRAGSAHKRVYVFELLHNDSQEERYMDALSARQALVDFVYDIDREGELPDQALIEKLDPEQLLKLIQP